MRSALVILLIALCVAFVAAQTRFSLERADTKQMFQEWQDYHMKSYSSAEEAELRYFNFLGQIQRSKDLNAKFNSTNYGITMFSDMSHEEFVAKMLMDPSKIGKPPVSPHKDFVKKPVGKPIPAAPGSSGPVSPLGYAANTRYDWTYGNCVTGVYNQEQCGSCWAWSAMEQVETDHSFQHNQAANQLTQQGTYPLSTQQIVDCDTSSGGCNGGWPGSAYNYIQQVGGLETQNQYPYTAQNGQCHDNQGKAISISGWNTVGGGNDQGLLNSLNGGGPVSICIDAGLFDAYTGGVIQGSQCGNNVDHCIQLTGFQTDGNGNVASWWIRNQWGSGWGQGGYVQFQYGTNTCDINSSPTQVNAN